MRVGMMKGGEVFDYENDDICSKCPLIAMKKSCLPKNKDSRNEVVHRNYCTSSTIKNSRDGL